MATGIVKAWGLTDAQVAQCTAGWQQISQCLYRRLAGGYDRPTITFCSSPTPGVRTNRFFDVLNGFVTDGIKKGRGRRSDRNSLTPASGRGDGADFIGPEIIG